MPQHAARVSPGCASAEALEQEGAERERQQEDEAEQDGAQDSALRVRFRLCFAPTQNALTARRERDPVDLTASESPGRARRERAAHRRRRRGGEGRNVFEPRCRRKGREGLSEWMIAGGGRRRRFGFSDRTKDLTVRARYRIGGQEGVCRGRRDDSRDLFLALTQSERRVLAAPVRRDTRRLLFLRDTSRRDIGGAPASRGALFGHTRVRKMGPRGGGQGRSLGREMRTSRILALGPGRKARPGARKSGSLLSRPLDSTATVEGEAPTTPRVAPLDGRAQPYPPSAFWSSELSRAPAAPASAASSCRAWPARCPRCRAPSRGVPRRASSRRGRLCGR